MKRLAAGRSWQLFQRRQSLWIGPDGSVLQQVSKELEPRNAVFALLIVELQVDMTCHFLEGFHVLVQLLLSLPADNDVIDVDESVLEVVVPDKAVHDALEHSNRVG